MEGSDTILASNENVLSLGFVLKEKFGFGAPPNTQELYLMVWQMREFCNVRSWEDDKFFFCLECFQSDVREIYWV